ncbi:MAG: cytochrome P450 [Acidimicrobiales bacterium]
MRIEQIAIPAIRGVVGRPWLARLLFDRDKWGNPFSPEAAADPYPVYELMRADGPVTYRSLYQQWFVTGYDEAERALSSDAFITSAQVDVMLDVRPYSRLSPQAKEFFALWLLLVDPPDHTRLRRLVSRAFTPKRVRDLSSKIEARTDELIDELGASSEPIDVVQGLCAPLPVAVIAEMLGLPRDRWDWSRRTTRELVQLLNPFTTFDPVALNATIAEIHEYWGWLADQRRADPRDDLMTAMVEAEEDGDRLSRSELIALVAFIMGAGHETTSNLLGLSIIHLARNPAQRELIRRRPELWPNAIEELIRYDSSVKISPRATVREVELGGRTIPAGSNVLVQLGAANRDPMKYDRPDELQLDREDPNPLSFGHGIHHCLGAALARLELRTGLEKFIEAFGDYEIDQATLEWTDSATLRGPSRLVIRPG